MQLSIVERVNSMKLTHREKALLSVLAVLLIGFGIVFLGILPQLDAKTGYENQISQNETMIIRMQQTIARYGKQEEEIESLKAETNESLGYIMKDLTNDTLDDLIRELAERCKITISTMNIEGPAILALDQYGNLPPEEEASTSYPIKQYLMAINNTTEEAPSYSTFSEVLLMKNTLTVSFDGSYGQMQQLVDEVRSLNTTLYVEESTAAYEAKTKKWKVQLVLGAYYYEDQK